MSTSTEKNKVYYGEYSLKHWIKLLLKKNIVLPEYQRYFVWDEKSVKTLIESLKENQFVPPVTIGVYKKEDNTENLILDGQQRLTSILLAYLGIYPDEKTYQQKVDELKRYADTNDDADESEELDPVLNWDLNKITEKGGSKEEIISNLVPGNYKKIDIDIDGKFLTETFLGFSYLVPASQDENHQQKYFSSVFRNINIQGKSLLAQESRAALYFLNKDLKDFFTPNFIEKYTIENNKQERQVDFVRYLSLIANFHKREDLRYVARGYKSKMEKYYEEFIYATINNTDSAIFGKFSNTFPNNEYHPRLDKLKSNISLLDLPKRYSSIIDLDIYLFGLIYISVFKGQAIDSSKTVLIKEELTGLINKTKEDFSHKKSPNNLKHLRYRISSSINVYKQHLTQTDDESQ